MRLCVCLHHGTAGTRLSTRFAVIYVSLLYEQLFSLLLFYRQHFAPFYLII